MVCSYLALGRRSAGGGGGGLSFAVSVENGGVYCFCSFDIVCVVVAVGLALLTGTEFRAESDALLLHVATRNKRLGLTSSDVFN